MKQKVALLLAGILVGALLMTLLPASAHHARSARRVQRQVNVLKRQVNVLQQRTQLMDRDGFYNGLVLEGQVVSFDCLDGDPAVWVETGFDLRFLFCSEGTPSSAEPSRRMIREFKASRR